MGEAQTNWFSLSIRPVVTKTIQATFADRDALNDDVRQRQAKAFSGTASHIRCAGYDGSEAQTRFARTSPAAPSPIADAFCQLAQADKKSLERNGSSGLQFYSGNADKVGGIEAGYDEILQVTNSDRDSDGLWPDNQSGLHGSLIALFEHLDEVAQRVLSAFAQYLWLNDDWFAEPTAGHDGVLQLIRTQRFSSKTDDGSLAFGETVDLISIVFSFDNLVLEARHRWEDKWIPLELHPGSMVVIVGDMMQRLANQILGTPTLRHPPVNAPSASGVTRLVRFSIPFRPDFLIKTLLEMGGGTDMDKYPVSIIAGDFKSQLLDKAQKSV